MRVVCPSCRATYEVPDTLLGGAKRRLRCNRCGHEWLPEPRETVTGAEPEAPRVRAGSLTAPAAPDPEPRSAAQLRSVLGDARPVEFERRLAQRSRNGGAVVLLGWLLSLLVLAGLGFAAYAWREDIIAAWPPSERVYLAVGLR
jgi:predicted Zn finger-like uncharacterized protein